MMHVSSQAEPVSFDTRVRVPGNSFLSSCPSPTGKQMRKHSYWQRIEDELYAAYSGICAYTCEYIPKTVTNSSVDHFWPKSTHPYLAYEWGNYRLSSQKANNNKGDTIGLVDPFEACVGWFVLEFPSCLVKVGEGLSPSDKSRVESTIRVLKLNMDDEYVQSRCDVILDYINGDISLNYLWKIRPFIAHELTRQGILNSVQAMFKSRK